MDALKDAFDANAAIFRDTLLVLDAAVQAMSVVLDAHISGVEVRLVDVEGKKRVDYDHYTQLYSASLNVRPSIPESPIVSAREDEIRIFGGEG